MADRGKVERIIAREPLRASPPLSGPFFWSDIIIGELSGYEWTLALGNNQKTKTVNSANQTLQTSDSGKVVLFDSTTARTATLPVASTAGAGWHCRVQVKTAATSGSHVVKENTASDTNILRGHMTTSGSAAATDAANANSGFTNVNFTTVARPSDYVDILCTGTQYLVSGHYSNEAAVTFT